MKPDVIKAFEKYKVLNERELHARYEIALETYVKTVNVEAQLMVLMANRYILPAALKYQKDVAESVRAVREAGGSTKEAKKVLDRLAALVDELRTAHRQAREGARAARGQRREAREVHPRHVVPAMAALRETGDHIEVMMPHEMWPLPTYREMLFIK